MVRPMAIEFQASDRTRLVIFFVLLCCLLLVPEMAHAALQPGDTVITKPPTGGSSGGMAAAQELAADFGALIENITTIAGIWFAFQSALIWNAMTSGTAQDATLGSFFSHFFAGVLAYHSRAFFGMAHNTIPMIPDFGRLVYDAQLMNSLLS